MTTPTGAAAAVVRVLPDVSGLDKHFDYRLPAARAAELARFPAIVGSMVRVPLHGRRVVGWIVAVDPPPAVSAGRLHGVAAVVSAGPDPELVDLAAWASVRWAAGRLRPFLHVASPARRVRHVGRRSVPPNQARPAVDAELRQDAAAGASPTPAAASAAPVALSSDVAVAFGALGRAGGMVVLAPSTSPLQAIAELATAGPTLVVMPTVDRAAAMADALRRRGLDVAVVPDQWERAAAGTDVVIGARTAAWAPCPRIAAAVVVDEHDDTLQEERAPTWHARDVVVERCRRAGVPAFLTSPAPSATGVAAAGGAVVDIGHGARRAGWPLVELVDRSDDEPWKSSLLTSPLIAQLRSDATIVCVHNVPGRSRVLACRSCRSLLRCTRCDAAVALGDDGTLQCGRCGLERPAVCAVCGATAFANLKPGVTRLREELEAAAGRPVVAVTGSDVGEAAEAGVYVGTEAVLHRVRRADVVAYLDFDRELLAPRYRAAEHALALLVRGARLVGARSRGGRLLVQTYLPDHEVLQAALRADPVRLLDAENERRRVFGFPPARALASVDGEGADALAAAVRTLDDGGLQVGGVAPYLVSGPDWLTLGQALLDAKAATGARPRIAVDPPRL